jgi:hypothetical protein
MTVRWVLDFHPGRPLWLGMCQMNFRALDETDGYAFHMGILLLILMTFAIMGGLHVILYCAFGCVLLFVILVLPSMAMDKIFRL